MNIRNLSFSEAVERAKKGQIIGHIGFGSMAYNDKINAFQCTSTGKQICHIPTNLILSNEWYIWTKPYSFDQAVELYRAGNEMQRLSTGRGFAITKDGILMGISFEDIKADDWFQVPKGCCNITSEEKKDGPPDMHEGATTREEIARLWNNIQVDTLDKYLSYSHLYKHNLTVIYMNKDNQLCFKGRMTGIRPLPKKKPYTVRLGTWWPLYEEDTLAEKEMRELYIYEEGKGLDPCVISAGHNPSLSKPSLVTSYLRPL